MRHSARALLLAGVAFPAAFGFASAASAAAAAAAEGGATLDEVVVTAQKRAQSLQDVPISVTAVTPEALQTARVTNVTDLNALVPNLTVKAAAGGNGIPAFSMRGVVAYGTVPGSERQVAMYIDGVYTASPRGGIFDLPDIDRIEVLRGPQGTLFGRNSTGGAISIVTRDPSGKFDLHQELTYGNYDQFRSKTRVDTPQWGPLSASVSYVHDERRGDIKNLGAGTVWDRSGVLRPLKHVSAVQTSPKYLGNKNSESFLVAVKFAPTDNFNMVYKYDNSTNNYSPEGVSVVGVNPAGLGPSGAFLATNLAANGVTLNTSARRPKAVNNGWDTPGYSQNYGHSLTANLQVSDNISIKNILAYRYTYTYSTYEFDGIGPLVNAAPQLGPVGAPFTLITLQNEGSARQYSNETQVNYDSKLVTVTAGAVYFHFSGQQGPPVGFRATTTLGVYPGGRIPVFNPPIQQSFNYATSKAAYIQTEVHVTPQIDLVGGYRITQDDKSGDFYSPAKVSFTYNKTKPSYMAGVNYKPMDDLLVYGKYSNGFLSGGSVGGIVFAPETAHSWEAGVKAEFLDHRLRTNLSAFTVKYEHTQSAQSGTNIGRPDLSTVVIDFGDARAKGFEFESLLRPIKGVTLGATLGYTDYKFLSVTPIFGTLSTILPTARSKWTSNLSAGYESEPVWEGARIKARLDANYRSKQRLNQKIVEPIVSFQPLTFTPATWIVNGRVALQGFKVAGVDAEVALWGRNLTNNKAPTFANITANFDASTSFEPARTFGIDLILDY